MFEFAWPWLLIILPLPIASYFLLPKIVPKLGNALRVPFYKALLQLPTTRQQHNFKQTHLWLLGTIWGLLVIAAAGPQWVGEPQIMQRSGRNLMLAVDLSGSMQIGDMQLNNQTVTRLAIVKETAAQFIRQRIGDRLGLILFGAKAYLQTPLTYDHNTVLEMLDDATIGLAGQTTAIGDAIAVAVKRLQQTAPQSRVLVLLTDGANNAGALNPLAAAEIAQQQQIKIYTIGIGASRMVIQGLLGNQLINPSSDLDEGMLRKISQLTGGLFFRAHDPRELQYVYQTINQLEPVVTNHESYRPIKQYYYWPLSWAFALFLLFWLRRA